MNGRALTVAVAALVVALAACSADDAGRAEAPAADPAAADAWSTRLDDGTTVRVQPQVTPVPVGRTTFLIELEPVPADTPAVTVDILSPSMPAHGIIRYAAVAAGPGRFRADAEIPMAGDWSLYVNLDEGDRGTVLVRRRRRQHRAVGPRRAPTYPPAGNSQTEERGRRQLGSKNLSRDILIFGHRRDLLHFRPF